MLEELRDTVRPEHRAAVETELARLDASVEESWRGSVDRDLALLADGQGIGGPGATPLGDASVEVTEPTDRRD